ncbi:MAG TPA: response regulator [Candidatus Acidoferrum sp.]|nr:response regulator [Candidatus Acidoferrum sp.]
MPKILVADDNSNIQKMVSLALKDQGIDVVAVGNGEAAVRKIADVRPDLVLADVFMPVRNGYEVCQFVKMDSALSHIPVILLVGAFDPLDEQEAQRVGADGVLKKPFIPPDPLISMVKSALQRSGAGSVSAAPAAKFDEPAPFAAKEVPPPANPSVPAIAAAPIQEFNLGSGPEAMSESFVEDLPARPEPLRIDSGSQPVAFGSLLETPGEKTETTEDDSSLTTANSPEFAMEHDWRDRDEADEVEEEEDEEPAAWRPEGTADVEEVPSAKATKPKSSANDWRTGGFEAVNKARSTGWEPEEETPAPAPVETVAPAASTRAPEKPATPPAPVQPMQPAQPIPAKPIHEVTPAQSRPFVTETWTPPAAPITPAAPVAPQAANEKRVTDTATAVVEEKPKAGSEVKRASEKKDGKDSWFSVSSSPWEGEIQKASQLASAWDAPAAANPAAAPKNGTEKTIEISQETQTVIEEAALPPMAIEAIREEAAQVAEDATFILETPEAASVEGGSFYAQEEEGVLEPNSAPAKPQAPAPAATPSPNMDDLVAKVLAKMNPEVLQAVTREILKPVVEAMVKEELKSKKS